MRNESFDLAQYPVTHCLVCDVDMIERKKSKKVGVTVQTSTLRWTQTYLAILLKSGGNFFLAGLYELLSVRHIYQNVNTLKLDQDLQ